VRFRREEGQARTAPVALRQDDFVEELDGRVFGARGFALVDEFVEHLRLPQHVHVLRVAVRNAFEEVVHVEMIDEAGLARFARGRKKILAVGVEEGGEATDKGGADLVGTESVWADEADCGYASSVDCGCAGWNLLVEWVRQWRWQDSHLHLKDSSSQRSSQTAHIDLPSLFLRMKQWPSTHLVSSLSRTGCTIMLDMTVLAASVLCA